MYTWGKAVTQKTQRFNKETCQRSQKKLTFYVLQRNLFFQMEDLEKENLEDFIFDILDFQEDAVLDDDVK